MEFLNKKSLEFGCPPGCPGAVFSSDRKIILTMVVFTVQGETHKDDVFEVDMVDGSPEPPKYFDFKDIKIKKQGLLSVISQGFIWISKTPNSLITASFSNLNKVPYSVKIYYSEQI